MIIIIILGSRPDDSCLSKELDGRARLGASVFKKYPQSLIILSGGLTNLKCRRTEAEIMEEIMLADEIPKSAIIKENMSRNTIENALYVKKKLRELKIIPDRILLVTSCYHVFRSKIIFENFFSGVNIEASGCFKSNRSDIDENRKLDRDLSILMRIRDFNDTESILQITSQYQ